MYLETGRYMDKALALGWGVAQVVLKAAAWFYSPHKKRVEFENWLTG